MIGWWWRQCLSPANQVASFPCSREQIRLCWKTGFINFHPPQGKGNCVTYWLKGASSDVPRCPRKLSKKAMKPLFQNSHSRKYSQPYRTRKKTQISFPRASVAWWRHCSNDVICVTSSKYKSAYAWHRTLISRVSRVGWFRVSRVDCHSSRVEPSPCFAGKTWASWDSPG